MTVTPCSAAVSMDGSVEAEDIYEGNRPEFNNQALIDP
jgi:hypothetical protein